MTPSAVTSDQLVVPGSNEETKPNDRVARSHSVGSIRDLSNTEAERRILDMVAAGGEAALAPSPTRTITPSESPAQPKRKLETVNSTENAIGIIKKKEKTSDQIAKEPSKLVINETMEEDVVLESSDPTTPIIENISDDQVQNLNAIEEICNELLNEPIETIVKPIVEEQKEVSPEKRKVIKKKIIKSDTGGGEEKVNTKKSPIKTVKKIVSKTKTADLGETLNVVASAAAAAEKENTVNLERKNSLPDENRATDRRRSRIFETAEKFQSLGSPNSEKQKKIVIPGVSVGNFKKEFERKASLTGITAATPSSAERNLLEKRGSDSSGGCQQSDSRKSSLGESEVPAVPSQMEEKIINKDFGSPLGGNSETGNSSIASFSLEEARKSMENSIALLNQAKTESSKEVDQLCAKTENVAVSDDTNERLKKIKNAREIIGNAIPVGRACMGK